MSPFGFGGKTADDDSWLTAAQNVLPTVKSVNEAVAAAVFSVADAPLYPSEDAIAVLNSWDQLKDTMKNVENHMKTVGSPAKNSPWASVDGDLKSFASWVGNASRPAKSYAKAVQGGVGDRARNETGMALRAASGRMASYSTMFVEIAKDAVPHGLRFINALED